MKLNRILPFGYEMVHGQILPHPRESITVDYIFSSYIDGGSFLGLAQALTQAGVPYHSGRAEWNKNMVKRILENERYTGYGEWPTLILPELFEAATKVRLGKTAGYNARPPHANLLRGHLVCGQCGANLQRDTRKHYPRWVCPQRDGCCSTVAIREEVLVEGIRGLLQHLARDVRRVALPATEIGAASPESIRFANEIRRETEKPGCNEAKALALILAGTVEQYTLCDDGGGALRAQFIRNWLKSTPDVEIFGATLFGMVLTAVTVNPPKEVELLLTSGQRVSTAGTAEEGGKAS